MAWDSSNSLTPLSTVPFLTFELAYVCAIKNIIELQNFRSFYWNTLKAKAAFLIAGIVFLPALFIHPAFLIVPAVCLVGFIMTAAVANIGSIIKLAEVIPDANAQKAAIIGLVIFTTLPIIWNNFCVPFSMLLQPSTTMVYCNTQQYRQSNNVYQIEEF